MRIATYNIHGGIGQDGRFDARRIAAVIGEIAPDVIALQEVSASKNGDLFAYLADSFGGWAIEGQTFQTNEKRFGNLLLSRWPFATSEVVDLAYPKREARNAIQAVVQSPSGPFRMIATHFGLSGRERLAQANLIADFIGQHEQGPLVIAGDFNDWPLYSRAGRLLRRSLGYGLLGVRRRRTFPARWPVLALDRILVRPGSCLVRSHAHRSHLSRRASDHLPLVADISLS